MKIKIDDTWFELGKDCEKIMILMDEDDKKNIQKMNKDCFKYAVFVDSIKDSEEQLLSWMEAESGKKAE